MPQTKSSKTLSTRPKITHRQAHNYLAHGPNLAVMRRRGGERSASRAEVHELQTHISQPAVPLLGLSVDASPPRAALDTGLLDSRVSPSRRASSSTTFVTTSSTTTNTPLCKAAQ